MFKFYVLLVLLSPAYGAVLYANRGQNVTLPCFSDVKHLCWYKQVAGEQPQIISSYYKYSPHSNNFHNQFKVDKRLSVHAGEGFYHLKISNVQDSDSAMYYCGHTSITVTEFYNGTFLLLKESGHRSVIQQQVFDSVRPGGSVTLNCTVHTGTSDGEYGVYWFKEDSRSSRLGIMYIHAHSSTQCLKGPESPAQSCVFSLSKTNVNQSDSGTYYCAVASCGEILFGQRMKLDVGGRHDDSFPVPMVAALLISVIMNIIVIGILTKMSRGKCNSEESQARSSSPSPTEAEGYLNEDNLYYPVLNADLHKRSRQRDQTWTECVYYNIKK